MGVDLTLCPDKYGEQPSGMDTWFLAHTRIGLHRDYALQEAIQQLPTKPLPATIKFDWYNDDGIEQRTTDPYGGELTYLEAGQFTALPKKVLKKCSRWNQAAMLFMQTLAPRTRVVLWWH